MLYIYILYIYILYIISICRHFFIAMIHSHGCWVNQWDKPFSSTGKHSYVTSVLPGWSPELGMDWSLKSIHPWLDSQGCRSCWRRKWGVIVTKDVDEIATTCGAFDQQKTFGFHRGIFGQQTWVICSVVNVYSLRTGESPSL